MDRHGAKGCWIQLLALLSPSMPQLMWHGWGFLPEERQLWLSTQTKPVSLTMASLGDDGRSKPTLAAASGL